MTWNIILTHRLCTLTRLYLRLDFALYLLRITFIVQLIVLGSLLYYKRSTFCWVCYSPFQRSVQLLSRNHAVTITKRTCSMAALIVANEEFHLWARANNDERFKRGSAKLYGVQDNKWLQHYKEYVVSLLCS